MRFCTVGLGLPVALMIAACAVGTEEEGGALVPQPPADQAPGTGSGPSGPTSNSVDSADAGIVDAHTANDAHATSDAADATTGQSKDASPVAAFDAGAACTSFAGPNVAAACHACKPPQACQANGCFNGYFCELATTKCKPAPPNCP